MPDKSDRKLASLASKGNREAFEELVEIYFTGIVSVCMKITGNYQDAQDCAQEAFFTAYRNIHRYDDKSSFFTWIYRIAVNTCYDLKRKDNRNFTISLDEGYETEDGSVTYQIMDDRDRPDDELIKKYSDKRVNQIIDSLPENFSRMIRLRDILELSYKEISEIEDISEGTVKSRLFRARAAFIEIASGEDLYPD